MSLPIPTNVESVAWAEEADRLATALRDLLKVIEADDLIPESVGYMKQAAAAMEHWPEIPEHLLTPSVELTARIRGIDSIVRNYRPRVVAR